MELPANPYSTPSADLYGSATGGGTETVSPSTIAQLAGTRPWVRFMSVLMWILSAFMVLVTVVMIFISASGVMKSTGNSAYNSGILVGTAIYYGVISFVIIYPALKLWKYANSIARLMATHSIADLDTALTEQRRYWKFHGIMAIIGISFAVIGFIAIMAFGMTAALKSGQFPFPK